MRADRRDETGAYCGSAARAISGYEDHFDRTLDDHDHFFCTCCHCLIDIDLDQQFNPYIDKYGNKFERRETTYFGLCSSCLKKNH